MALIVATGLSREWAVLAALYALVLVAAAVSSVDMGLFVKRVWLGMGLFSAVVILPSIFFIGHRELFHVPLGLFDLTVHRDGLVAASIFVLRVCASVSLAILLILTTKWADILKSLRVLRVPSVLVLVLAMTYRYIFLVLHTANAMFLARKSRIVATTSGREQRWWVVSSMGVLMNRSLRMSEDVYQAMLARGFQGEMRTIDDYRMRAADWLLLAVSRTDGGGSDLRRLEAVAVTAGRHAVFELEDVGYTYNRRQVALDGINLTVSEGEAVAVLGANGCGKSTLLKVLDGLYTPATGHLRVFGTDIQNDRRRRGRNASLSPSDRARLPGPGRPTVLADGRR